MNAWPSLPKTGIKLHYWPATGKAHMIRYMFAEAGVDWEDVSFVPDKALGGIYSSSSSLVKHFGTSSFQKFQKECREKGGNSTNNLPMLEIEGKFYTQSLAIYNYVARRTGLYPKNAEDAFVVDNIFQHREDAMTAAYELYFGAQTREKFVNETVPKHLGNLERLLGDNEFYVPGSYTAADLIIFDLVTNQYVAQIPDVLKDYPKLAGLVARVGARPAIQAFHASERCAKIDVLPIN